MRVAHIFHAVKICSAFHSFTKFPFKYVYPHTLRFQYHSASMPRNVDQEKERIAQEKYGKSYDELTSMEKVSVGGKSGAR